MADKTDIKTVAANWALERIKAEHPNAKRISVNVDQDETGEHVASLDATVDGKRINLDWQTVFPIKTTS